MFARFGAVLVLSIATLVAITLYFRMDFIYLFERGALPPSDMPRTEVRQLPAFGEDPALTVWVTQPEPGFPVVLYFMGETGALSVHEPRLRDLATRGYGIAAMAYRGGGGQKGTPGEAALYRDALRVYAGLDRLFGRHVTGNERVFWGFSLGAGLAARLAAEQEELALILEAPFTSLCESNLNLASLLPGCVLLRGHEYPTLPYIALIGAPLLVLHGTADNQVPVALGRRVYAAAVRPKFMEEYAGAGHEDLARFGATGDAVNFINVLRGAR